MSSRLIIHSRIYALPYIAGEAPEGAGAHLSGFWRIDEIVPDFRLEDVWALPTPGRAEEFGPSFVEGFASADPLTNPVQRGEVAVVAALEVGELLGWDEPDTGIGSRVTTLRERLPEDLSAAPGPKFDLAPIHFALPDRC